MKFTQTVFLLAMVAYVTADCLTTIISAAQQPSTATTPQPRATASTQEPTNQEINNRYVKQFSERIAGREKEPAEQVFKNIRWLKGVPAEQLLMIMNLGYSRALGVSCTHCHVEQDFASDEKRPKRVAREMAVMHRMINEQLKKMENLETKTQERAITCSTCHRGAINPRASGR